MGNLSAKSLTFGCLLVCVASSSLPLLAEGRDGRGGGKDAQDAAGENWRPALQGQNTALEVPSSSFVVQPSVSAAQAAAQVRRAHGGRVLSVSPTRRGDALGYRVRVLVDGGRVKTVYVASGRVNSSAPSNPAVRTIGDR